MSDSTPLSRTAQLLPTASAKALESLAPLGSPDASSNLTTKLLSELGSAALEKDMPLKAKDMKEFGKDKPSLADTLTAIVSEANKDKTPAKQAQLAANVATLSGLKEEDVKAALAKGDEASMKRLHDAIEKNMSATVAAAAATNKEEIYFRYEIETNAATAKNAGASTYKPGAIDPAVKAKFEAEIASIPSMVISDEKKRVMSGALFTVLEAAPDHAPEVLQKFQELKKDAAAHLGKPSAEASEAFFKAVQQTAVDASIRNGGNDTAIVDALSTLTGQPKEKVRTELHADAARKLDSVYGTPAAGPDSEEEKKKAAEREKDNGGNGLTKLLEQPGGMLILLIAAVIGAFMGDTSIIGSVIGALTGDDKGGKDQKPGADTGKGGEGNYPKLYTFSNDPSVATHLETGRVVVSQADQNKIKAYAERNTGGDFNKGLAQMIDQAKTAGVPSPVEMLAQYNDKGEPVNVSAKPPTLSAAQVAQLETDVIGKPPTDPAFAAALKQYAASKNTGQAQNDNGEINPATMKAMLDQYAAANHINMGQVQAKLDAEIAARGTVPAAVAGAGQSAGAQRDR